MSCGTCQRVRKHLPAQIRARLEEVERRIEAKKAKRRVQVNYTTTPQLAATAAGAPRHLPALLQGGAPGAALDSREAAHSAYDYAAQESTPASAEPRSAVAGRSA